MSKMRNPIITCAIAAVSSSASAQFKCVDKGGATTFQQQPCAGAVQQQKLDIRGTAAPTPAAPTAKQDAPSLNMDQRIARDMERERRIREIQFDLSQTQEAINRRNQQMSAEIDALRSKKASANNNLAGATWEASISQEMQAVTQKYKAMNDLDLERAALLRADLVKRQAEAASR